MLKIENYEIRGVVDADGDLTLWVTSSDGAPVVDVGEDVAASEKEFAVRLITQSTESDRESEVPPDVMASAEYAQNGGNRCPKCGSHHIETLDSISVDGSLAWQDVSCLDCKATWTDEWKLTGYGCLS